MSEELGKIEKPSVEEYKTGRKLYFVPLVYSVLETQAEYIEKYNRYWEQVDEQLGDLELKLGSVNRIYHEFISESGDDGLKTAQEMNEKAHEIVKKRIGNNARLETIEQLELLTEFMDWSRCLAIGLQNQDVWAKVYELFLEAGKKRNEHIARQIDETLEADEIGMLLMREGHQVQFPADVQVFYVAPPALDEIKRWFRDQRTEAPQEDS